MIADIRLLCCVTLSSGPRRGGEPFPANRTSTRTLPALLRLLCLATGLLTMAPIAAEEPPATLPKEFIRQLPLLMTLSDEEFEGLLASLQTAQKADAAKPASNSGGEETDHED